MNISYLFRYLWRKKWLIILPTVIAVAATWFFFRNKAQSYSSVAELSTGYLDVNPLDLNHSPNNTVLFNNVIQTLKSNQVMDQVSYSLLLHDLSGSSPFRGKSDISGLYQILTHYPGGKAGLMSALANKADSFLVLDLGNDNDRLIRRLADIYGYSPDAILKDVDINRIEGSDFIFITSTTENPKLSAYMSNSICRSFLAFYHSKQGEASSSSLDTLKSIMDAKRQLLDNKLKLLQGGNDLTVSSSIGMIGNLQEQLTQQKNNLIAAQVGLDNVDQQITAAAKNGGVANNEDIIVLRNNIDNLYTKYVSGGSKDGGLLNQINKLRNDLQQKLSVVGDNASGSTMADLMKEKMAYQVQVQVAQKTIADLQGKINVLNGTVQSSAARAGLMQGIQNEVEVARQDYMKASDLYNEALNFNIFPGNNFKQTMIASPPLYPDPSKEVKKIAFAGFGVFFALVFILLFFELLDTSIKSPSYLKDNVHLPLLANLKRIDMKDPPIEAIFSVDGSLPRYKRGFREQVKQLRYEVENSGKKIILVTGYHSGSGKTTLIQSLAGSLSLKKSKVLLIDANFHNNTLTRKYNAEPLLQQFELKEGLIPLDLELKKIVTDTEDENIKVLGCAAGDYTPDEVLPVRNVFTGLRKQHSGFDYIFIDCAGLNQGPDCKELLKYADSVILVFAADQPLTAEDKKLVEFLKKEQVDVLGTILNKVSEYNLTM